MLAARLCRLLFCCALAFALSCGGSLAALAQATDNFQSLAQTATAAREAGKTDEAVHAYSQALALRPDWAEGWYYLGTLQYDQNHYPEAIAALKKLVELAPNLGPAWSFLGLSEFEAKDYANSITHLEKAQSIASSDDPELTRVSAYHLALLLIRSGESERASSLLRSTFGRNQLPGQIKTALGLALLRVPLLPEEVDPSQDALLEAAGEAALLQDDPAKFLAVLSTLIAQHPQTPYLHYVNGLALESAHQTQQALIAQQDEARISPRSALPWIEISALQLELKNPEESLRAANQAVALAPNSSAAHLALSKALRASGKDTQAAQEAQAAQETQTTVKLSPNHPQPDDSVAALYKIHSAAAVPVSVTATGTDSSPSTDFDTLARTAQAAQSSGDAAAAISAYQHALALRPDWDAGQWSLAMLYYSTGHFPETIAALKPWIERKPNDGTAWAVLGLSEFELKDYDNAFLHFERGNQLGLTGGPAAVEVAGYHLAILLNRKGQFEAATGILTPLAGQPPLATQTRFALGMAMLRIPALPQDVEPSRQPLVESTGEIAELLLASKYDQAFPKLQQLIAQYPAIPFLHYTYGTALDSLSQYDEAKAQMHEEIKISPRSALPWIHLASIALQQQLPQDALTSAQTAAQLAPGSADAHYLLGRAWISLGNVEKAIPELEAATAIAPSSPEIHFALAKAYAKSGQSDKAAQERAAFSRLNTLAEEQRAHQQDQSYRGPHDAARSSVLSGESPATASPAPQ
jgi:tetratricopeptide (TPR) repeat protein